MAGVWTNAWEAAKMSRELGGSVPYGWTEAVCANGSLVAGISQTWYALCNSINSGYNSFAAGNHSFVLGSGSKALSAADSDLASRITSGFTISARTRSGITRDAAARTSKATYEITMQRTASGSVTVTEWGLFTAAYYWRNAGTMSSDTSPVLIYRATLDTPLTVAQYESVTLTAEITVQIVD